MFVIPGFPMDREYAEKYFPHRNNGKMRA